MALDLRTIYFMTVLVFVVCTLIMGLIWRQARNRFEGIGFLTIDFAMQTFATLLITLRGPGPHWLSIGLAHVLVLAGSILGYMGLERLVGKRTSQAYNGVLLVVFAVSCVHVVCAPPDPGIRYTVFSLGTLAVWFQCAWLMLYRVPPDMRPQTVGVGAVFAAYCIVNILRMAAFLFSPFPGLEGFTPETMTKAALPAYQGLFILLTVSLVLMINKRLLLNISKEEEKFSKAFHLSSEAVVLARLEDGTIIEVNRQFEALTGYSHADSVGRTVRQLGLWAREEDREEALDQLSSDGSIRGKEYGFRNRSGDLLIGVMHAEVLTIDGEKCILTGINDITQRKRAEEELERLNRSLQERVDEEMDKRLLQERLLVNQSRLAAMGKMIGAIAHQWRQPLSTLAMMIQRFHAAWRLEGASQERVDRFKTGAMEMIRHMSDTIEEFRSFHQPEKEKTQYDPCTCIAGAVRLFAPQFQADGITLEVAARLDEARGSVYGYANEFKHVILNLIGNARHAILRRRVLEGDPSIEGRITVRVFPLSANTLAIDVEDNGCGISDDIAPHLFKPYFTTKEEGTGTGIGLYLSKGILESRLKGRIYLLCGLGGAVFRIELPLEETQ